MTTDPTNSCFQPDSGVAINQSNDGHNTAVAKSSATNSEPSRTKSSRKRKEIKQSRGKESIPQEKNRKPIRHHHRM